MLLPPNHKEALAVRWKNLLCLALLEYFEPEGKFNKLIVNEGLNFIEAIARSFVEEILKVSNADSAKKVFEAIYDCGELNNDKKNRLGTIIDELTPLLGQIRNPETHNLLLPTVPQDTVRRMLRRILEVVSILDNDFWDWCRDNHRDFLRLGYFYYVVNEKIGMDNLPSKEQRDLHIFFSGITRDLKQFLIEIEFKSNKGKIQKGIPLMEKNAWEIIKTISNGELSLAPEEIRKFEEASYSWNPATL